MVRHSLSGLVLTKRVLGWPPKYYSSWRGTHQAISLIVQVSFTAYGLDRQDPERELDHPAGIINGLNSRRRALFTVALHEMWLAGSGMVVKNEARVGPGAEHTEVG
jgi:hypothetical protein